MRRCWNLAIMVLLTAVSGCEHGFFKKPQNNSDSVAKPIDIKDIQPGMYCEFDMRMPPTANENAYRCYLGAVKEVNANDVLLSDAIEESWEDYGTSYNSKPIEAMRGTIRIPLAGVEIVGVTHPPKKFAEMTSATQANATQTSATQSSDTQTSATQSSRSPTGDAPSRVPQSSGPSAGDSLKNPAHSGEANSMHATANGSTTSAPIAPNPSTLQSNSRSIIQPPDATSGL